MGKSKRLFTVDLLDTVSHRIIETREIPARYPREAMRKLAKFLPTTINLKEMRDKTFDRYVFLASRGKKGKR